MAFFGKRKKEFNPNDVEIPEFNFDDFEKAISDITGKGSQDVKQLDITLKDDSKMFVYVENGKVSFAYSESNPLNIETRLYWIDEEIESSQKVQAILHSTDNYFEIYNRFMDEDSKELSSKIEEIYRNYTLSTLEFGRKVGIKSMFIEMMIDANVVLMIRSANFISILPSNLNKALDFAKQAEELAYKPISNSEYNEIKLYIDNNMVTTNDGDKRIIEINDGETDEERLVIAAAESSATLQDVKDNSSGFQWQEVLQATADLIYSNKIEYEDSGENIVEELKIEIPVEEELDMTSIIDEIEENVTEVEDFMSEEDEDVSIDIESLGIDLSGFEEDQENKESKFNISWNLEDISKDITEDEGFAENYSPDDLDAMYENNSAIIEDEETYITPGLAQKVTPMVETIFSKVSFFEENVDLYNTIIESAKSNDTIEKEISRQDEIISERISQYIEGGYEYDDTQFQINVNSGMYENELEDDIGIDSSIPEDDPLQVSLNQARKLSNERFFNIEAIESSRHMKNITRKSLLLSVSENVRHLVEAVENSENNIDSNALDSLNEVIAEKIEGIDAVKNKALHLSTDDNDLVSVANPAFFESNNLVPVHSPIFTELAKKMNIDIDKNNKSSLQSRIDEVSHRLPKA